MAINWFRRAQTEGTPFVDGEKVTFFWSGAVPPLLIGDFTDWEQKPVSMQRAGKNAWIYTLNLPLDAYMEYAFLLGEKRLPDAFNPRRTPNGVGKYNHYFYMPQAQPTTLVRKRKIAGLPAGKVSHHTLPCAGMLAGKQRTVYLYQPAAPGPYPLLVVWDGTDYLRRARLPEIVDALIAQKRIQPVAMALVANGGSARYMEYLCSESTLVFLLTRLLPFAGTQLDLFDPGKAPGAYGVLGASMGGLMALYTGLRLPHIFGRVLSQSGAFLMEGGWEMLVMDLVRRGSPAGQKIRLDVGLYDFESILSGNRLMQDLLGRSSYEFTYREYPAGHNYPAWRDEVWRGLEYLFPG